MDIFQSRNLRQACQHRTADQAANLAVNFFFICPAQSVRFYLLHSEVITPIKCAIEMHLSFTFYLLTVFFKEFIL